MDRRRFITGTTSLLLAPALVRASSLEYVPRQLIREPQWYVTVYTCRDGRITVPLLEWVDNYLPTIAQQRRPISVNLSTTA